MFSSPDAQWTTYAIAFVASSLLVYGIIELMVSLLRPERKRVERRMDDNWARAVGQSGKSADVVKDLTHEQKWAMARWLAVSQRGTSFRKICEQAALPWPAHQVLVGIGFAVTAFLIVTLLTGMHPIIQLVGVVLLAATPVLVIVYKRNARLKKLNNQMPEALELMSQALRAGHALPAGIQLVAEQLHDPIGTEFARVHAEQDLGIPMEEALEHLAQRIDLLDMRMFVTAIQIQRQTGGDLTEMMDRISAVIRDRIRILGQVRALTAEGRLSGWILTLLPLFVLLLLFYVNPAHPQTLFDNSEGVIMMIVAVVMQILGMLIIRKIVNIKV